MSAFMVDPGHIDYLVTEIQRPPVMTYAYGPDGETINPHMMDRTELGRLLYRANLESMRARYGDSLSPEEIAAPEEYTYRRPAMVASPVQTIKAAQCFEYQSCEYFGWDISLAHDIITRLINSAISSLPGMESATWAIYREEVR